MSAIVEKIQKLLHLANSPNEHEAKLAAQRANELLVRHNLKLQEVEGAVFDYTQVNQDTKATRVRGHQLTIARLLQDYFFVRLTITSESSHRAGHSGRVMMKKQINFLGRRENVEIAGYVFVYLDKAFPQLWEAHRKATGAVLRQRASYYDGLADGIRHVLDVTKFSVERETGLVLKGDPKLDKLIKDTCEGSYQQPDSGEFCAETYAKGTEDGKNVRLRKGLEDQAPARASGTMLEDKR